MHDVSYEDVLEINGKLLFLWSDEVFHWLEEVNPETGEFKVIWEYTSTHRWDSFILEDADYGEFDYRIKGNYIAVYLSSENPDLSQVFEAPYDDTDDRSFSFDILPETGFIAYSVDDGVYAGREGKMNKLLSNRNLKIEGSTAPEGFDPYYTDVHLINGGRQLVAKVFYPGALIQTKSVMLINLYDGAATLFEDLFPESDIVDIRYIDDKTVMARSRGQVTKIDAESKKTEILPAIDNDLTVDFNTYVSLQQEKDDAGITNGILKVYSLEPKGQEKQILKITGENAWISFMTENYAGVNCSDGKESYIAIVPLPEQ